MSTDIILICPPSASEALHAAFGVNPFLTGLPLPKPDILSPKDLDLNTGTAEILRRPETRAAIKSDFVVLPCDLVCDFEGEKLLQAWMVNSASFTDLFGGDNISRDHGNQHSGGLGVWYDVKAAGPVKGEETDFIATTTLKSHQQWLSNSLTLSKLVYTMPMDSLSDLMEEKNSLPVRHGLLRAHPQLRMYTSHRDAHIYILPRWILDFVAENDRLDSIGEDVIGWWAKAGWQEGLADKLQIASVCDRNSRHHHDEFSTQIESTPRETLSRVNTGSVGVSNELKHALESKSRTASAPHVPPILAYIHSIEGQDKPNMIRRVDTAQLLLATSLRLAKLESIEEVGFEAASCFAHLRKVAFPEGVKQRTVITKQDSLVAENVTIEERTAIKESVVGANCQINEGTKLLQCLLMEGVIVGKGCKLTKCILGKRCVIGDYSVLTDCEVQENLLVEPRSQSFSSLPPRCHVCIASLTCMPS